MSSWLTSQGQTDASKYPNIQISNIQIKYANQIYNQISNQISKSNIQIKYPNQIYNQKWNLKATDQPTNRQSIEKMRRWWSWNEDGMKWNEVEVEMKWVKCQISKSNIKYQISKSNIQLNMKSKSDRPTDRQSKIEMKLELMMWVEWRWDDVKLKMKKEWVKYQIKYIIVIILSSNFEALGSCVWLTWLIKY